MLIFWNTEDCEHDGEESCEAGEDAEEVSEVGAEAGGVGRVEGCT